MTFIDITGFATETIGEVFNFGNATSLNNSFMINNAAAMSGSFMPFLSVFLIAFLVFLIPVYIYFSIALMTTAKRLKSTLPPWLAFVPIGNMCLMSDLAKMPWWFGLFFLGVYIPYIGFLISLAGSALSIIWMWKIIEARNKPGWWILLIFVPLFGPIWSFILWGKLAWGKD